MTISGQAKLLRLLLSQSFVFSFLLLSLSGSSSPPPLTTGGVSGGVLWIPPAGGGAGGPVGRTGLRSFEANLRHRTARRRGVVAVVQRPDGGVLRVAQPEVGEGEEDGRRGGGGGGDGGGGGGGQPVPLDNQRPLPGQHLQQGDRLSGQPVRLLSADGINMQGSFRIQMSCAPADFQSFSTMEYAAFIIAYQRILIGGLVIILSGFPQNSIIFIVNSARN